MVDNRHNVSQLHVGVNVAAKSTKTIIIIIVIIIIIKTRWASEPKSKAAHSTPFLRNLVVWEATICTKPRQDLH